MTSRFWIPALFLVSFGLVNVYSASMPVALEEHGDALFYFKRQLAWIGVGGCVFAITSRMPLEFWYKASVGLFAAIVLVVVAMKVGGFGIERNGAARWIGFAGFTLQPSEMARPLLVIYLAKVLSSKLFEEDPQPAHYLAVLGVAGCLIAAVAAQPDFGGAVLLAVVLGTLLFVAGAPVPLLTVLGIAGLLLAAEVILAGDAYRRGRLVAFLDPWADADRYGFQLIQSYLALGTGGIVGKGAGLGMQKLFYLPEAHTDFIFSVIGEEWGLIGCLAVLLAVGWMLWEIFQIALRADKHPFAQLLVTGLFVVLAGAYVINLSVATGLMPTKGLALPLISYGGSAMVSTAFILGLLARTDVELGPAR